jgi:hypothetical protein
MRAQLMKGAKKRALQRYHSIDFERLSKDSVERLGSDRD